MFSRSLLTAPCSRLFALGPLLFALCPLRFADVQRSMFDVFRMHWTMIGGARLRRALIFQRQELGLDGVSPHLVHRVASTIPESRIRAMNRPLTRPTATLSPTGGEGR